MPADRLFHPRLGQSQKVSLLTDLEFRVWVQYVLSADDFGVMRAHPSTLQANNRHLENRPSKAILRCLETLITSELVYPFVCQGTRYIYQRDWQDFQRVSWPSATMNPAPPADEIEKCTSSTRRLFSVYPGGKDARVPRHDPTLREDEIPTFARATEREIEALLVQALPRWIGEGAIVETQMRIGNLYCDIVVVDGPRLYVIEVKRGLLTDAAITQVLRYTAAIRATATGKTVIPMAVGSGVALRKPEPEPVICLTVSDAWVCSVVKNREVVRYLTESFPLIDALRTRAPAPAKRLTDHGSRLVASCVSEGSARETAPPFDLWLRELQDAYPPNRVTSGRMTEDAFLGQFPSDAEPPSAIFRLMMTNLATNVISHEWRIKGMVPRLDRYLREGLWRNVHASSAPVGEQLSAKTNRTLAAAAEILSEADR